MSNNGIAESKTNLRIFEDVIYRISELAAADVEGVRGFARSKVDFVGLFTKSERRSEINIRTDGGSAEISLGINVSGSSKLKAVAEKVQQRVKDNVQSMTGIPVTKVNVYVHGIVFENE